MKKYFSLFAVGLFLILNACGPGKEVSDQQTQPVVQEKTTTALDQPLPIDPNVRIGKLDNGLTYYIRKNEKPEDRAELRLVVNAGSIQEAEDQQGLAHFAEHMLFNGTKNFEKNELIDFFELTGMKFGPHVNAYTSFDETVYMLRLPTDSVEILEKGIQVLEDWAHLALFDEKEIDKERGVVVEEWRLSLGPEMRMAYQYLPVLLKDSKYAERLPIGKKEVLDTFHYETIKRFYNTWYRPNLMAVVAVGDFDVEHVEQEIISHFKGLKNPENPEPREVYEVPDTKDMLVKVVTDKEASFANAQLIYKHPVTEAKYLKDYRKYLMSQLYSNMLGARYEELKQQANPPFVFAASSFGDLVRSKSAYSSYAFMNPTNIEAGLEALIRENERVERYGFTASELERAKKTLLKQMESQFKERDKFESQQLAQEYVSNFLSKEPIPGIEYEYKQTQSLLPGIELSEVNALADKWITDDNVIIVITAPEKEGIKVPSDQRVREIYKTVQAEDITAYVDEEVTKDLLPTSPSAAKIVKEEKISDIGVTEITFANGAKVVLKPTNFKNDEILYSAFSKGGHSLYTDADYYSAAFADGIMEMSGVGDFSQVELEKYMAGKEVRLTPYISEMFEGFQGSTSPDDLETLLQLQYLYFTQPRKDQVAFESFTQQQKSIFANLMSNPNYYFQDVVQKTMSGNHPRAGLPTVEDVDRIDLDKAMKIYKERFGDASDFTFLMVGNFDVEEVTPMLAKYIGGLPATNSKENFKDIGMRYPKGKVEKKVNKGTEPKALVYIAFNGDFDYEADNRYKIYSLADVLRIKLRESMREDKGGVYGVGVSADPDQYPTERYKMVIQFGCAPERVDELVNTAFTEIKKLQSEGAQQVDIQKVTETQRQSRVTDLKENKFWLSNLQQYYMHNEDPKEILEYLDYVNDLESEDIKEAAKKYLNFNNYTRIVMLPEK